MLPDTNSRHADRRARLATDQPPSGSGNIDAPYHARPDPREVAERVAPNAGYATAPTVTGGVVRCGSGRARQAWNGQSVRVFESVPVRVVAAILRRDNRLLLCHRHPERAWYPDVWDLPGGHVEHGETPTEALARELREELAVDLQSPLGLPFEEVADSAAAVNMTIWLIDYAGAVVNHARDEHDELRWVTADEIAGLVLAHPSYVELLGHAAYT